jgi:hypothetical protein
MLRGGERKAKRGRSCAAARRKKDRASSQQGMAIVSSGSVRFSCRRQDLAIIAPVVENRELYLKYCS